jgi:hypothetical protein
VLFRSSTQSKPTAPSSHNTHCTIPPTVHTAATSDTVMSDKYFLFSFLGGSTEELKKILDTNVLALSICTIQAFQSMKERGVDDGHIIHINRLDSLSRLSFVLSTTYLHLVRYSDVSRARCKFVITISRIHISLIPVKGLPESLTSIN